MNASDTRPPPGPSRLKPPLWRTATALAAVLLVLAGAAPANATHMNHPASRPPAVLQAALDRLVTDGVPGVIALQRQGNQTWRAASGVSDLRRGTPMRAADRFRIGSNTKTFVATVVLQLVGEGRVRLADSLERWLPATVPNGSAITMRQLLNHTSGIYDYTEDPRLLAPYAHNPAYFWPPRDLIALATSHPPLFAPGANWSYSNTNYILLGLVIEAVTHHSAATEVHRRIIQPIQLRDTVFPLRDPTLPSPYTRGYLTNLPPDLAPDGVLDSTVLSPSIAWTAGGIISTVTDLARFHRALFTGQLLKPQQMRELTSTVPQSDYGLGISHWDTPCGTAWGHGGAFPGYRSVTLTSPDGSRQAVIALNADRILTDQTLTDLDTAVDTIFCSTAGAAGTTPVPSHSSRRMIP
jgi:D-alanyl-D-alanine carboxypeptidase